MPTAVEGILAVEGEPTGDGRMFEVGALTWEDTLPFAIVWDREEGDHTAMTVGSINSVERRMQGNVAVIWGAGWLSESEDEETAAAVLRVGELLDEGAIGGSIRWDQVEAEIRVKRSLVEEEEMMMNLVENGVEITETDESGERIIVAKFAHDDALEVTTKGRIRHFALVDTGAYSPAKLSRAQTGAIAAASIVGEWSGREVWFEDPNFGDFSADNRLRYDPDRAVWSCPPTLISDGPEAGRVFGHIAPMGICLRGRPDRCVTPPDGDLMGFMRGRAPAAGGLRTGVICVGGGHCDVGIGAAEATQFYDNTGRAIADVRVGKDRYGYWFAGMARPGATEADLYAFAASDVSGHWEYTQRGRITLVGLPAVNVGGFPKGYLTYQEFQGGLAASAGITTEEGCGSWSQEEELNDPIMERLDQIGKAVGELYAAHLRSQGS